MKSRRRDSQVTTTRASSQADVLWRALLVMCGVIPFALGAPHLSGAKLPLFGMWDAVSLPKAALVIVGAGGLLAVGALRMFRPQTGPVRWSRYGWLAVASLVWAGVSTIVSVSPRLSAYGAFGRNEGLVAYAAYVVVALAVMMLVDSASRLATLCRWLVVPAVVMGAYSLAQAAGVDPLQWPGLPDLRRATGTFGNPVPFAQYLAAPAVLAIGLAIAEKDRRRAIAWWAGTVVIWAGLFVTFTRGSLLGALAGAGVLAIALLRAGWRPSSRDRIAMVVFLVAIVAVVAVAAVTTPSSFIDRFRSTFDSSGAGASNGRIELWKTGIRAWLDRPVFGWGPDAFSRAFYATADMRTYGASSVLSYGDNAHNIVVQLLVTLGLPGALLVLAFFASSLVATARAAFPRSAGSPRIMLASVWAALVAALVSALFGVTMPSVSVWLWLLAGALLATRASGTVAVPAAARPVLGVTGAAAGLALILIAAIWVNVDLKVGNALYRSDGAAQGSTIEDAWGPGALPSEYLVFAGTAFDREAVALAGSGASDEQVRASVDRAVALFDRAAKADPSDVQSRISASAELIAAEEAYPGEGYGAQALSRAIDAVELAPEDPGALSQLALAYYATGDVSSAKEVASQVRKGARAYAEDTLSLIPE